MIEHWHLADTSTRGLAGAGLHVSRWKPEGPRPKGARSERSGDDSAVPARLGRETPTPHRKRFCRRRPAAPRPSPGKRSGASHGEELFAERCAMLMAGMAGLWSVPPPSEASASASQFRFDSASASAAWFGTYRRRGGAWPGLAGRGPAGLGEAMQGRHGRSRRPILNGRQLPTHGSYPYGSSEEEERRF